MAVSRALCFATGGLQPSSQSASFKSCPVNYSIVAVADTIFKSATERPNSMFLPGKKSGTMFACSRQQSRSSRSVIQLISWEVLFSHFFLKLFWFFSIFLSFSQFFWNILKKNKFGKSLNFACYRCYHRRAPTLSVTTTGLQEEPEDGPRRRHYQGQSDSHGVPLCQAEFLAMKTLR